MIASAVGIATAVFFPVFDTGDWKLLYLPGSFAMGFFPVAVILSYSIFVSDRFLKKLHAVYFLLINFTVFNIIISGALLAVIVLFGLSPDFASGKAGISDVLLHPDSLKSFLIISVVVLSKQMYNYLDSFSTIYLFF